MAGKSSIEWTNSTWNPVTGCTKITAGCDHCYAATFAERFRGVPGHTYEMGFDLMPRPERLKQPLASRQPQKIFVNSMSDLFHKDIDPAYIDRVFDTMAAAHWHVFQVLTKRGPLMRDYMLGRYSGRRPPKNVWLGVSVENAGSQARIEHLRSTPAAVRFLSVEPLIGPLWTVSLAGIDWVILGGESGAGFRPMAVEWAREVRDQCIEQGVAFFFKQWSAYRPKTKDRLLDGREWNEYPAVLPERIDLGFRMRGAPLDASAAGRGPTPEAGLA